MTNKEKFLKLVDDTPTDTVEKNRQRIGQRELIRQSQEILILLLDKMDENNFTTKYVSKICECDLSYLENLLRCQIINVEQLKSIYDIVKMHSQPI